MKLFEDHSYFEKNVLPFDGSVFYYGKIFNESEANEFYKSLLTDILWRSDEIKLFGKTITTKREVAWYGDKPYLYTYSKTTKKARIWNELLSDIKDKTEKVCGKTFNSCLLNLYHNGTEGMSWHSDSEKDLAENGTIASLSFGAERRFSFRHKSTKQTIDIHLEHGSLLIMKDETQKHWLHRLPVTKKISSPRINLTFRSIRE